MASSARFPFTAPAQEIRLETLDAQGKAMIVRGWARLDSIETDFNGNMHMTLAMVPGYLPGDSVLTVEYREKEAATPGSKHFPNGLVRVS